MYPYISEINFDPSNWWNSFQRL